MVGLKLIHVSKRGPRASAVMVLTMKFKQAFVLQDEGFQLSLRSEKQNI